MLAARTEATDAYCLAMLLRRLSSFAVALSLAAGALRLNGERIYSESRMDVFEDVGAGVFTNYAGSSGFYIARSVFLGRNDPDHLIGWAGARWEPFHGAVSLPTVTDGFNGRALDLGALEFGDEVPVYGPRPWPGC
jgi:hypothetical protein